MMKNKNMIYIKNIVLVILDIICVEKLFYILSYNMNVIKEKKMLILLIIFSFQYI